MKHYHRRSLIESAFSAIKRKFGDAVRAKTDTAMRNEALAKILSYNVCCCISAMYELNIDPMKWAETTEPTAAYERQDVLRFPAR